MTLLASKLPLIYFILTGLAYAILVFAVVAVVSGLALFGYTLYTKHRR